MIGVINVKVNSAKPNMPLCPCFAFKDSPSSLRILDVPKQIGSWRITKVFAMFHYPDDVVKTKSAVREGNVWVATVEGCSTSGKVTNGLTIAANGIDEDGNAVNGYVLGIGDIYVMNRDDSIAPDPSTDKFYVRYCDSQPSNPTKGDAYVQGYMLNIYNGTTWVPACDISAVEAEIDKKRDVEDLAVYGYAPWTMYSYNEEEVSPPLNFIYQKVIYENDTEIYGWMSERKNGNLWEFIGQSGNSWFIEGGEIGADGKFTVLGGDSMTISDDGLSFTEEGNIPVDIRRTAEYAPTSDSLAKVSQLPIIPTSYDKIQDTSGNVINADRTVGYNLQVNAAWKMVNSLTHQQFVLTSDNGTTFSYSDPEPYTVDSWKAEMSWLEDSSAWEFITYQWADGELEWESVDDVYFYFTTQDQTDMENDFWHGTRPVATTGELALKSYVDGQIGQVLTEAF